MTKCYRPAARHSGITRPVTHFYHRFSLLLLGSAREATIGVINTNESDAGSLRKAILDNNCPRAPLPGGVDSNPDPDKPLKDKGCGNKDKVTKQVGADVLTDVVIK